MDSTWLFNLGADIYAWFTAQSAWRASCARLADTLSSRTELHVLDLGCGPGVSTFELARRIPSAHLVGLDAAPRMLQQARRRQPRSALHSGSISWLRADAARLPLPSQSVDACTGHSFLYLVADRREVLAEIRRVLAPGGQLVLMEPSARGATLRQTLALSRDVRYLVSVSLWRPFSRVHGRFTRRTLAETLESAGFEMVHLEETLNGLGLLAVARVRS